MMVRILPYITSSVSSCSALYPLLPTERKESYVGLLF